MEDKIEMHERMTAVEQSVKSAHLRLNHFEKLVESVHTLAVELKETRKNVSEIKEKVEEVEHRPQKRYDTLITAIITSLAGGVVGYLVSMVLR